jgi:uncharacterized lipoprotein YmbA
MKKLVLIAAILLAACSAPECIVDDGGFSQEEHSNVEQVENDN